MESLMCLASSLNLASLGAAGNGVVRSRSAFLRLRKSNSNSWQWKPLLGSHSSSIRRLDSCSSRVPGESPIELTNDLGLPAWNDTIPVSPDAEDERIEILIKEIKEIFQSMNDGETSPSAYDTAWVARIPSVDNPKKPQFPTTLDWILSNQLEDGSWGEPSFFLVCDRLVCTLACVLALMTWSKGDDLITKGLLFLRTHAGSVAKETTQLRTCGFEIVFPSMLNEAKDLGLHLPYDLPYLKEIFLLREKKIKRIPLEVMHSVHTTLLYSLEALQEVVQWERILKLQSRDGSFLSSPSSTAVVFMRTGDKKCLEFLITIVKRFGDNAPAQYPIDLLEHIWAVDTIQRLGIDHHFRKEISNALDYVYRNIGKRGVSWGRDNPVADIDDTCMALRLLRLHGYPVSSDVLEYFKDDDGDLVCFPGETHRGVSDMFNLYRFSQISFPGEKILKEAKAFVERYLRSCLQTNQVDDKWSLKKALHKEIDYALKFPWKISLQRLEAREYINHYGENDVWIAKAVYWMYNVNNPKYLELAKLDFNKLQTMYNREIKNILKWWNTCGFDDTFVTLLCPKEIHFSIAATLYEPEFSNCRVVYTKCNCIENVVKGLFEKHESIADLRAVCQAVKQWSPSLVHSLSQVVKVVFMGMYDTLNDLAIHASNAQGKDMFPYLHDLRLKQIQAYLEDREIRDGKKLASLVEYIEHGKRNIGVTMRTLPAMFLMGEHVQDFALRSLDYRSTIHDQLSLFLTLSIDIWSYNTLDKETSSTIHYYMEEENCTDQEALGHINGMIEDAFDELVHEYLKPSRVPNCCRRLMFEHARITQFFLSNGSFKEFAMDCLFNPV